MIASAMGTDRRRAFTAEDAAAAGNAGADAFDEFVSTGADFYRLEVHGPALVAACGDVRGLRVLDLGCGQGWFSRNSRRAARASSASTCPIA